MNYKQALRSRQQFFLFALLGPIALLLPLQIASNCSVACHLLRKPCTLSLVNFPLGYYATLFAASCFVLLPPHREADSEQETKIAWAAAGSGAALDDDVSMSGLG